MSKIERSELLTARQLKTTNDVEGGVTNGGVMWGWREERGKRIEEKQEGMGLSRVRASK